MTSCPLPCPDCGWPPSRQAVDDDVSALCGNDDCRVRALVGGAIGTSVKCVTHSEELRSLVEESETLRLIRGLIYKPLVVLNVKQ